MPRSFSRLRRPAFPALRPTWGKPSLFVPPLVAGPFLAASLVGGTGPAAPVHAQNRTPNLAAAASPSLVGVPGTNWRESASASGLTDTKKTVSRQQFADALGGQVTLFGALQEWRNTMRGQGKFARREYAPLRFGGQKMQLAVGKQNLPSPLRSWSGSKAAGAEARLGLVSAGTTYRPPALDRALVAFDQATQDAPVTRSGGTTLNWAALDALNSKTASLQLSMARGRRAASEDGTLGEEEGSALAANGQLAMPYDWKLRGNWTQSQLESSEEAAQSWSLRADGPIVHPWGQAQATASYNATDSGYATLANSAAAVGDRTGKVEVKQDVAVGIVTGSLKLAALKSRRPDSSSAALGEKVGEGNVEGGANFRVKLNPFLSVVGSGVVRTGAQSFVTQPVELSAPAEPVVKTPVNSTPASSPPANTAQIPAAEGTAPTEPGTAEIPVLPAEIAPDTANPVPVAPLSGDAGTAPEAPEASPAPAAGPATGPTTIPAEPAGEGPTAIAPAAPPPAAPPPATAPTVVTTPVTEVPASGANGAAPVDSEAAATASTANPAAAASSTAAAVAENADLFERKSNERADVTQAAGGDVGLELKLSRSVAFTLSTGYTRTVNTRYLFDDWQPLALTDENRIAMELNQRTRGGSWGLKLSRRMWDSRWDQMEIPTPDQHATVLRLEAQRRLLGPWKLSAGVDWARHEATGGPLCARRAQAQLFMASLGRLDLRVSDGPLSVFNLLPNPSVDTTRELSVGWNTGSASGGNGLGLAVEYARREISNARPEENWRVGITYR